VHAERGVEIAKIEPHAALELERRSAVVVVDRRLDLVDALDSLQRVAALHGRVEADIRHERAKPLDFGA